MNISRIGLSILFIHLNLSECQYVHQKIYYRFIKFLCR